MSLKAAEFYGFKRIVTVKDSNNIVSLAYDPVEFKLLATFQNGSSYLYQRVKPDEFGKLVSSPSVGKAFNRYIRPKQNRKVS